MLFYKGIAVVLGVALPTSLALAESLKFTEKTAKGVFKILDQDDSGGNSSGDVELWSAPAVDAEGNEIGRSSGRCHFISETEKHCTRTLTTGEGTLVFVGYVDLSKPQRHYTIVGGDNSYVGASGSMIGTDKHKEEGTYEIEMSGSAAPDRSLEQRIAQLEQERDRLKQHIAKLERALQASRKPVSNPEAIVRALAGKKPVPTEAPKVDTQAAIAERPSNELKLTDVQVEPTDSDNHFRFSFSIIHPGNEADQVVGTIWIAVNGLSDGKPTRLALNQVSSETHPYLDMRFRGQQDVDGELSLPPDFEPKNIAIEAKPYDKKYRGASVKFDWTAED
jgi:hypothetical protein